METETDLDQHNKGKQTHWRKTQKEQETRYNSQNGSLTNRQMYIQILENEMQRREV